MKHKLVLSTTFAATLIFSSASALGFTPTCKFFNFWCGDSSQSAQINSSPETKMPQPFSFAKFFNEWKTPTFFGSNTETPAAQTAQPNTPFSPNTINTANNTTNVNSADFGFSDTKTPSNNDTSQGNPQLMSPEQILQKQLNFNDVLKQCSDGSTTCIAQVTHSQTTSNKQTESSTPVSGYLGPQTSDNLIGVKSPNYDNAEDNSIDAGPLQRGVENSQLKQSLSSFNGSSILANRGTGNCSDYGIDIGGSCPDRESYKNEFKAVVSNLCSNLTGKRLQITSGNRSPSCNARVGGASGSSHMSGLAMDTRLDTYSGDEKVLVSIYFMAQGFNNFGGYGPNKAMHFDLRSSINRWGPNYSISSCEDRLFPDYFRKAMALVGSEPCKRDSQLRQKAVNYLKSVGKEKWTIASGVK